MFLQTLLNIKLINQINQLYKKGLKFEDTISQKNSNVCICSLQYNRYLQNNIDYNIRERCLQAILSLVYSQKIRPVITDRSYFLTWLLYQKTRSFSKHRVTKSIYIYSKKTNHRKFTPALIAGICLLRIITFRCLSFRKKTFRNAPCFSQKNTTFAKLKVAVFAFQKKELPAAFRQPTCLPQNKK
jgi:hypothetical protein